MNTETDANKTQIKDSFQRRHFHKIQIAYRCINILNIVLAISLLLLLGINLINVRYVSLGISLLPLDLYVFYWIFHKVVIWKDSDKTGLPNDYICLGFHSPLIIWLFVDGLFVLPIQFSSFQCIQGEKYLTLTMIAIFTVLFFVSALLLPGKPMSIKPKLEAYFTIAMISIIISWTLTEAVYYAASESSAVYAAVVLNSSEAHNRGTDYYASVELRDGSKQRLSISEDIYHYTQEHKAVLIQERTSFFGTIFASVHNPLTFMENQLEIHSEQ